MPLLDSRLEHATVLFLLKNARYNRGRRFLLTLVGFLMSAGGAAAVFAADVDVSKLPPAAEKPVDFSRDIAPIFDKSCLRCHGPERPKSGFRLDNRDSALKGGKEGVDILPGKSAESPLIHYVSGLVPDMQMPPEGKGDPLTAGQIGLLRAWIDAGAPWGTAAPTNIFDMQFSPMVGGTFVHGDNRKFREHYWMRDGVNGGLEDFEIYEQKDANTRVTASGHALLDDYKLTLNVDRNELGFIHSGWTQFRKYYDDSGGYFPGPDPHLPQSLGKDLFLDRGRAWIDFGLTLPNWPRMVLGYEYDYRRGEEATTAWGSDGFPYDPRNIAPSSKHIAEDVHIIKFDFDGEFKGVNVEDRFRGEFYSLNTHYTNVAARNSVFQDATEHDRYFQGANSIRLDKQFTGWLYGSGGYFYSKLSAVDSFTNAVVADDTLYPATVPNIELSRETHLFNLNGVLGSFGGLTLSGGAQSEWTRQHGYGTGQLNGIAFVRPPGSNLNVNPALIYSDYDQNSVTEMVGLRYTKIPFTSLFADARLKQEKIGQRDADIQQDNSFLENPSYTSEVSDLRAGFATSPWERMSLSAHYRRYESDSRYKTNDVPQPLGGYPGFILWRDQITDEVETKLVLRLASWLKTSLSYQILRTDYNQATRPAFDPNDSTTMYSFGGPLLAGRYDSQIYSLGTTITPARRIVLTTMFSYQDTRINTPNPDYIQSYKGNVYSALFNGLYIVNQSTDLSVNYSFSLADYAQPVLEQGPPPTGIRYQQHAVRAGISRRINKNMTARLQYGYFYYDEPTLAGFNDYTAHSVFATLACRIP
jgi:mono/diheme cytochrome c family protein